MNDDIQHRDCELAYGWSVEVLDRHGVRDWVFDQDTSARRFYAYRADAERCATELMQQENIVQVDVWPYRIWLEPLPEKHCEIVGPYHTRLIPRDDYVALAIRWCLQYEYDLTKENFNVDNCEIIGVQDDCDYDPTAIFGAEPADTTEQAG